MSPLSENVRPDTVSPQTSSDIPTDQQRHYTDSITQECGSSTPTPSSGPDCQIEPDKSNHLPSINPALVDYPMGEDNVPGPGQSVPGQGQSSSSVRTPGDRTEVGTKTGPTGVVSLAAQVRGQAECVHDRRGTCSIHGPGARKMTKPIWIKKTGPDGLQTSVRSKKTWYLCRVEVGTNGQRLRQTRISFGRSLQADMKGERDNQGSLGEN